MADDRLCRTTILGHNFSAPFFISPAAAPGAVGGYVPKDRELGLVQGAGDEGILYIPALYAEMSIEEQGMNQGPSQVMFQQVKLTHRHDSSTCSNANAYLLAVCSERPKVQPRHLVSC